MQLIFKSELRTKRARKMFDKYYQRICLKNSSPKKKDYQIWKTAAIVAVLAELGEMNVIIDDEPGVTRIFIEYALTGIKS